MPFYIMPVDWSPPEKGFAYTGEELKKRVTDVVDAMNLVPGTLEYNVLGVMSYMELDTLFNNAPN